ncbi:MAG: hypothetical protein PHG64_13520 [Paludibacter sp.]|nr:hypothetical protein [Paludibacter sp.]
MNIINTFRRAKKLVSTDKLLFYAPLDNANGKNATVNKLGSLTPTSAGSGSIVGDAYVLNTQAGDKYTDLTYEFDTTLLSTLGYGDNVVIGLWTRVSPNATRNMLSDFIIKKDSSSYTEASHNDTDGIFIPWYTQGYNDIGLTIFVNNELKTGEYHFIMFKMTTTELQQFNCGRFLGDNSGNIIENTPMVLSSSSSIRGWKFNTLSIGITTTSWLPPVGIASHGRAHLQVWSNLTTAEMQAVYENEVPPTPPTPTYDSRCIFYAPLTEDKNALINSWGSLVPEQVGSGIVNGFSNGYTMTSSSSTVTPLAYEFNIANSGEALSAITVGVWTLNPSSGISGLLPVNNFSVGTQNTVTGKYTKLELQNNTEFGAGQIQSGISYTYEGVNGTVTAQTQLEKSAPYNINDNAYHFIMMTIGIGESGTYIMNAQIDGVACSNKSYSNFYDIEHLMISCPGPAGSATIADGTYKRKMLQVWNFGLTQAQMSQVYANSGVPLLIT